ncbi:hypothetical protein HNP81_004350 [Peribacillus huizhouensis]|uniref:YncI copper-binding domain-containing protein n=1 Tax=Peribacillus huizhouensis TaxID=1501239 RepID=A0ABR6CVH5_9BACI|nr:hypothetical protein [Peribacillus huizhouensis]
MAHVTVQPQETLQGKYEVFTVRVPSENETIPTMKIEVKFPTEVNITRFEPKSGWKYEVQKDASGKITSVIWTTEGKVYLQQNLVSLICKEKLQMTQRKLFGKRIKHIKMEVLLNGLEHQMLKNQLL